MELLRRIAQLGALHPSGHIGLLGTDEQDAALVRPHIERAESRSNWVCS
jgi:hypothetical protein